MKLRTRRKSNIVINDETRLFIQDLGAAACDKVYDYHSCVAMSDITLAKSQSNKVYEPSSTRYDEFVLFANLTGKTEPGTSSLQTNYTLDNSVFQKYYLTNCTFDMQVHIGKCETQPNEFEKFDKALIFKDVNVTQYNISSLMTLSSSSRSAVTESLDFTFEKMYEVTKPDFNMIENDILSAGPLIESFTFCNDNRCNLCVGTIGRYFLQLVACGEECNIVRIVYTLDNGETWRVKPLNICDGIECSQFINRNIIIANNQHYYVNINPSLGKTINNIIDNSVESFPLSLNVGTELLQAFTKYNISFYVGTNGRIFVSEYGIYKRLINSELDVSRNIFSIHSIDGINFVAGSEGRIYIGTTNNSIVTMHLPSGGNVYAIEMISDCSFIASTGLNGGVLLKNGKLAKIKGIRGAITKFAFFNEDIGYASSVSNNQVLFWQSVDGGKNWQELSTRLSGNYVVTDITICELDHNIISICGRKLDSIVAVNDLFDINATWDCQGKGFVLLTK